MYKTKSLAQISPEHKSWNYLNGDKKFSRKWISVSDDVYSQIQCVCAQFIKEKLKRDGALTKKISIIFIDLTPNSSLRHIIMIINRMSIELERLHPRTFSNVTIPVLESASEMVDSIGRSLFKRNDITWGKIISFLTISSAIAAEVARSGQPELIQSIVDSTISVLNDEVLPWIETQGGWSELANYIRPTSSEHLSFLGLLSVVAGFLLMVHWIWIVLKFISRKVTNFL